MEVLNTFPSICEGCLSDDDCDSVIADLWDEEGEDDGGDDGGSEDCSSLGSVPNWDSDGNGAWDDIKDFQNNGSITSIVLDFHRG